MKFESNRILELDGLRGLAILLVILFHIALIAPPPSRALINFMYFGWSGVDLFFVLSGFLIGGILIDHRESQNYFKAFYARRFFRIIPIYFLIIIAYALAYKLTAVSRTYVVREVGPPMGWLAYFSFTNNLWIARHDNMHIFLPVTWSLAVEEQFYLTIPFIVRYMNPKYLKYLVIGTIVTVCGLRSYACLSGVVTQNQAYVFPLFRADALMIGIGSALLVRNEKFMEWLRSNPWALYIALAVLGTAIAKMGSALPAEHMSPATPLMTFGLTVVALFYATLLLLALTRPKEPAAIVGRFYPLRYLGKLSYCIYLVHEIFFGLTEADEKYMVIVACVSTIAFAQISWTFFESKLLKFGHRVKYGQAKPVHPASVPPISAPMLAPETLARETDTAA